MRILFIGDIVGKPGREILSEVLGQFINNEDIDACIANGENAAGGKGLTYKVAMELFESGINAITLGNHTWMKKDILSFIDNDDRIIRPANYPLGVPGKGTTFLTLKNGEILGLMNLQGRVYMNKCECPFIKAISEINNMKKVTNIILVDFHAEATAEKKALAIYLDGKVSAVIGTHTHVQTADETIMRYKTAYITDVGMVGPADGVIGVDKKIIEESFILGMPHRHQLAKGDVQFNAVIVEIDSATGKALSIKRINNIYEV